eukprot:CAMPEP_0114515978 /NCGR_PEP_ID=MMETSP0109-20121206/17066_1 /TAXON_ID=29199 /ORGANISM="Chlorarachnion reptans, Strain CCCM449" /LENGTH=258 /DNA_ID=CAMNT_0001696303 /DNA_START=175 /DNA_END=952 /DNA_ORIENTATION=-
MERAGEGLGLPQVIQFDDPADIASEMMDAARSREESMRIEEIDPASVPSTYGEFSKEFLLENLFIQSGIGIEFYDDGELDGSQGWRGKFPAPRQCATKRRLPYTEDDLSHSSSASVIPTVQKKIQRISCTNCQRRKLRCDSSDPCGKCTKMGLQCIRRMIKRRKKGFSKSPEDVKAPPVQTESPGQRQCYRAEQCVRGFGHPGHCKIPGKASKKKKSKKAEKEIQEAKRPEKHLNRKREVELQNRSIFGVSIDRLEWD